MIIYFIEINLKMIKKERELIIIIKIIIKIINLNAIIAINLLIINFLMIILVEIRKSNKIGKKLIEKNN
jgi:hypothetical protein